MSVRHNQRPDCSLTYGMANFYSPPSGLEMITMRPHHKTSTVELEESEIWEDSFEPRVVSIESHNGIMTRSLSTYSSNSEVACISEEFAFQEERERKDSTGSVSTTSSSSPDPRSSPFDSFPSAFEGRNMLTTFFLAAHEDSRLNGRVKVKHGDLMWNAPDILFTGSRVKLSEKEATLQLFDLLDNICAFAFVKENEDEDAEEINKIYYYVQASTADGSYLTLTEADGGEISDKYSDPRCFRYINEASIERHLLRPVINEKLSVAASDGFAVVSSSGKDFSWDIM